MTNEEIRIVIRKELNLSGVPLTSEDTLILTALLSDLFEKAVADEVQKKIDKIWK
jgi:hypothetical protein